MLVRRSRAAGATTLSKPKRGFGAQGRRAFEFESPVGCRIEFVEPPAVGERVWIRFDGLEAIEGTVRWVEGHIGGVRFERPLHEAVFQQLAAASKQVR